MGGEAKTKCDKLWPIGGVINETKHQTKQKTTTQKTAIGARTFYRNRTQTLIEYGKTVAKFSTQQKIQK